MPDQATSYLNTYWVLRHGRSLPNEAGIIVSSLDNGVKPEHGLAEAGKQQAAAAGQQLAQQLQQLGVPPSTVRVYSSPFSRTRETASIAAAAAGLEQQGIQVTPLLAERFFGASLELTSHSNYSPFWAFDAADATSLPPGSEDAETVAQVSARLQGLLQELEQRHTGQHILLVGHGDTLSILQATFLRTPLSNHRHYALDTAELKRLNVRGGAGVAGGAVGYEAAAAAAAEAAQQQQQPALVG